MKEFKFTVVTLSLCLLTMAGCDAMNPPKKTAAPQSLAAQPVVAATVPEAKMDDNGPLPAGVLARVGSWSITRDEFSDRIKAVKESVKDFDIKEPGALETLLQELVRQQLLIQDARREKLQDSKEVKAAMEEFENTLLVQANVTRLTRDLASNEEEAKKYYDENPEEFKKPLEKQLREIVVPTEAEANEILLQVLQGGDFAQIAKDRSKASTKDQGGDLGFKTEASFAAMAAATSTLKKGGISSVFENKDKDGVSSFYIVKVEDIRGGEVVAFTEVKDDLVKFLKLRKQQDALAAKVKTLEKDIKVQLNQDLLKEVTGE
jgi:peptidyl-prolyl cis-trans isomerase C